MNIMAPDSTAPNIYRSNTPPVGVWSGAFPLPAIGTRVEITFNGFGAGEVVGYFREFGYVGVEVKVDKRPDWHIKQCGDKHPNPMVFGIEIKLA